MKEYIERAAVLKVLEEYYPGVDERLHIVKDITSIPTADVAEVRHGSWIDGVCSECGFDAMYYKGIPAQVYTDYCPSCGARMDKEDEHEAD